MNICVLQELEAAERAYEDLARLAVFMEQTRHDERQYESSAYEDLYQWIEEHALYALLCQLKYFIRDMGHQVSVRVTRSVMTMDQRTIPNRALRHLRDYIVIRNSLRVLENLHQKFDLLKQRLEAEVESS